MAMFMARSLEVMSFFSIHIGLFKTLYTSLLVMVVAHTVGILLSPSTNDGWMCICIGVSEVNMRRGPESSTMPLYTK